MALPNTATFPLILPLSEAAQVMGVAEDSLRNMVQSGKIRAFVDPDGAMYIQMTAAPTVPVDHEDDINARLSRIRREDFAHLEGQPITVSEAAKKYNVQKHTILAWVRRYTSVLRVLERGYRLLLDEAGVAYLAAIHHARKEFGIRSGSPLVDENGLPNLIKHPTLSAYRKHHLK